MNIYLQIKFFVNKILHNVQFDMSLAARLKTILDDKKLTHREFGRLTGYSHANLSNVINGKTLKPKVDLLEAISVTFPEINIDWLVAGRGSMYRTAANVLTDMIVEDGEASYLPEESQTVLSELVATQKKLLDLLDRDLAKVTKALKKENPELAKKLGL